MKNYKFEINITEGNDEFWEENNVPEKAIPALMVILNHMFEADGFLENNVEIKLTGYEDK